MLFLADCLFPENIISNYHVFFLYVLRSHFQTLDAVFGSGCSEGIPTVSHWGLIIMGLLLLTAGKLRYGGHVGIQNGG